MTEERLKQALLDVALQDALALPPKKQGSTLPFWRRAAMVLLAAVLAGAGLMAVPQVRAAVVQGVQAVLQAFDRQKLQYVDGIYEVRENPDGSYTAYGQDGQVLQGQPPLPENWAETKAALEEAGALSGPGIFYAVQAGKDSGTLVWNGTYHRENALAQMGLALPERLGDYTLQTVSTGFSLNGELLQYGSLQTLSGDYAPGQVHDLSAQVTAAYIQAIYTAPGRDDSICRGLSVSIRPEEGFFAAGDRGDPVFEEEAPFDGGALCPELEGWRVERHYRYSMGSQHRAGWSFIAPGGQMQVLFAEILEEASGDWYHGTMDREMTAEELATEGAWLLPLAEVAEKLRVQ